MISQLLSIIAAATAVTYHTNFGQTLLAQKDFSLADRYAVPSVNQVMADNILLTLSYMSGKKVTSQPNWNFVEKPFTYTFKLNPGQTFAFHDDVLPQFQGKIVKTTNSHFNAQEGFKYDGWLFGDGVCHLASFMNIVARNAGLNVLSPVPHDFAKIPDVPRQFGVSIYDAPGSSTGDQMQNLYVTNNKNKPIAFVFEYKNHDLKIEVKELN